MQQGNVGWLDLIGNVFSLMWASLDAVLREEEDGIGFKQLHHLLRKRWNLLFHLIFWFQVPFFYYHTQGHLLCMKLVSQSQGQEKNRDRQTSSTYTAHRDQLTLKKQRSEPLKYGLGLTLT